MSLRTSRQELMERRELLGVEFCRALAAAADQWLAGLLLRAAGHDLHGLALVAVGGYGRGELCPYSDLDVVLVHDTRREVTRLADAVWYPVWDEGIRLDHSVRRPSEVLDVVRKDLRAQLGFLDGRLVAGDAAVSARVIGGARELWRNRASLWLPVLAARVAERHAANGDVAFLLEPDLKESHGGLRDINALEAVALAIPTLCDHVDLSELGRARELLTAARVELHRNTGRATDRLLLQEQDQVAATLGYEDADVLMGAVSEAGRTVAWAADDVWRRQRAWREGLPARRRLRRASGQPPPAPQAPLPKVVEPGIAVSSDPRTGEEVVIEGAPAVLEDPTLALRVAAVAAERSLPISRAALEILGAHARFPEGVWPPQMRESLVRVLAAGDPAIPALEALDQKGVLTRILPEWAAVRNRPQRNAYHRFTVDRHLLETAAQAAPLALKVARPDLLLLGALLHDIGKGYPGDHTEAGVKVVRSLGERMGLGEEDLDVLVGLVHNHLLLADLATRRDLDDPATVSTLVDATGDRSRLELLVALTEADSIATGPAAWGTWKAGLVADLASRAAAAMAGSPPVVPESSIVTDRHRALMRQVETLGRSVIVPEAPTLTVVARDRAGLLSAVTGVLALRGLDVRSAKAASEEGFAVEVFSVEPARGRWPDWERVADELDAVLRGTIVLEELLAEQERTYHPARRSVALRPVPVQIYVDNSASANFSVVEVRAADAVGLLHRITAALFDEHLDVVSARVSTLGHEVVDAFYVRGPDGGKVVDPELIRRIERSVQQRLTAESGRI